MAQKNSSSVRIFFRVHAIQRMFERQITTEEVINILKTGEGIEEYPGNFPYSSRLILGWSGIRPLHVVSTSNSFDRQEIIITVYEPDPDQWELDYKRRKS